MGEERPWKIEDETPPLVREFQRLDIPTEKEIAWLLKQGAPEEAMREPWALRAAAVVFHRKSDTFEFAEKGKSGHEESARAIIFRAEDNGRVLDLAAWQPRSKRTAMWRASAFCIGDLEQIFNPATYFGGGALRIHSSPLGWLKARREGIVIVDQSMCYAYLRNCQRIECEDKALARSLERWVLPPKSKARIGVAP